MEDGALPSEREAIAAVEAVLAATGCEIVCTRASADTHSVHRATAEVTLSAARRSRQVLAYESPTTLPFTPMLFVDLDGRVGSKLELVGTHRSQIDASEHVDLSAVATQARHRGWQGRVTHAEGFEAHRFVWARALAPSAAVDLNAPWGARALLSRQAIGAVGRHDGSVDDA